MVDRGVAVHSAEHVAEEWERYRWVERLNSKGRAQCVLSFRRAKDWPFLQPTQEEYS